MLTRRVALLQQCSRLKAIYLRQSTKAKLDETELAFPERIRFPIAKAKLPKIKPMLKELFIGKFNADLLTYPEPQTDQRANEFNEWLKTVEDYVKTIDGEQVYNSPSFSTEIRDKFKELGIYGGRIPFDYDGLDLLDSEYLRLIEVLSTVPKVGINFLECNNFPVELLKQEATVEQKNNYLRKIALGEYYPVICANESSDRIDPDSLSATAYLSHDEKTWILKGQKRFIQQDNNANLFIVYALARIGGDARRSPETLSAFLVEKSVPGVGELIPIKSPWLGTENMFSVNFNETVIPYGNLIGEIGGGVKSLENYFTTNLHFSTGVYISCLRSFLDSLIKHVIKYNMHERESVKKIVANITLSLYAMESIAYLTTSFADLYNDQDLIVEQAVAKEFCSTECIARLAEGLQILDSHLCANTFPFEQVMRNQMFAIQGNNDLKTYIGLLGIQHAGVVLGDEVKHMRNPFEYPATLMRKVFQMEESFPKLQLQGNLHPSFQPHIHFLEESIGRMMKAIKVTLINYGAEAVTKEIDMHQVSEIASLIYAITACFGRASRSYCIGLESSEYEMQTSIAFAYKSYYRIKKLYEQLLDGEAKNGNLFYTAVANRSYELKKYILQNPLTKNW
ncbi:very long-chain specific acyl-CoA dehydrogenase, mitochondrial-like [Leptopilina heterotoma]|uniref:very long-chain specific acyl-CoA dehydrogenase, mitochondrial-like n=1 Tax=Leptopilina heterotoma TaxID=63436 RepID=UPI001CA7F2D1|nr:very long-chain specific acyl-CoA dehydrogenase, mitochondrial-like [Leptopilina heterotoma]